MSTSILDKTVQRLPCMFLFFILTFTFHFEGDFDGRDDFTKSQTIALDKFTDLQPPGTDTRVVCRAWFCASCVT